MKLSIAVLTLLSISLPGLLLLKSNPSLALPMNGDKHAGSMISQPKTTGNTTESNAENTTEDVTEEQSTPINNRQISRDTVEQSPSDVQIRHQWREELGVCRSYIPPDAEPGSFEYREGLDECWYGSD